MTQFPCRLVAAIFEHHSPNQLPLSFLPVAIPLATETPKLTVAIVGWCSKMHLGHGNPDFLLPLTHAEHCTVCLMSRWMKTLH